MNDPRFDEALLTELCKLGQAHGLDPLDWRVIIMDDLPVLEGAPMPGAAPESCAAWAESLDMDEYGFETDDGSRSWFLVGDRWTIEISTLEHPKSYG